MMSNIKIAIISVLAVFMIVLLCIFGVQNSHNKAIILEENVETAKLDIDVQLQRRVNVLSELAECVKEYDLHEYKTINDVIEKRGANISEEEIENINTHINAVIEQYPELNSQANYKELMKEISTTENLLAQHKKAYNRAITSYKKYVKSFPTRIYLDWTGYEVVNFERFETDATDNSPMDLFGENK